MGKTGYVILAVGIIVLLLVIFFVSFVLYRKTPLPKGCEALKPGEGCSKCTITSCDLYNEYHEENDTKEGK